MDTANRHGSARTARRLVGPILVLPVLALSLRCEPFRGGDEPSPVPGSDADARSDGDSGAADAGSDAGTVNLLTNPGFEESLSDCTGWNAGQGTAERSEEARTGSWACLICPTQAKTLQFYLAAAPIDLEAGTTYVAEAWLKAPPSRKQADLVGITLSVPNQAKVIGDQLKPTDSWARSRGTIAVQANGKAAFEIFVFVPNGGCVLVDDASLHRQP